MKKMLKRAPEGSVSGANMESLKRHRALLTSCVDLESILYFERVMTIKKKFNDFVFITKREAASRF